MDRTRVEEIFRQSFNIGEPHKSTIDIRKKITEEIIFNILADKPIEKDRLELILKTNDAIGRLGYFLPFEMIELSASQSELFNHIEFIFKVWQEAMEYTRKNYDSTEEGFKKLNLPEEIDFMAKSIEEQANQLKLEFSSTGSISMPGEKFKTIDHILNFILCHVLVGKKFFIRFEKEKEEPLSALNVLYHDYISRSSNTKH